MAADARRLTPIRKGIKIKTLVLQLFCQTSSRPGVGLLFRRIPAANELSGIYMTSLPTVLIARGYCPNFDGSALWFRLYVLRLSRFYSS